MTKEAPAPEEIVLLVKCGCERTDAHTIDATAEKSGLITPTSESCCDSDDPRENACEDTYTLKIEDEDPDSEGLERLESRNLLKCEKVLTLVLFEGNIVSTSGHVTTQKCQH